MGRNSSQESKRGKENKRVHRKVTDILKIFDMTLHLKRHALVYTYHSSVCLTDVSGVRDEAALMTFTCHLHEENIQRHRQLEYIFKKSRETGKILLNQKLLFYSQDELLQ